MVTNAVVRQELKGVERASAPGFIPHQKPAIGFDPSKIVLIYSNPTDLEGGKTRPHSNVAHNDTLLQMQDNTSVYVSSANRVYTM
jgi:hypothetical protein